MEPAGDKQVLQRLRQRFQRCLRQAEPAQTVFVEAVGAAGQQHPVAGLQPYGQRIGETGQQKVARIDLGTRAGVRDRHFVEAVEQQEGGPGPQMGKEVLAGQVGLPATGPPTLPASPPAPVDEGCGGRGRRRCPRGSRAAAPAAAAGRAGSSATSRRIPPAPERGARDPRKQCSAAPPSGRRSICRRRRGLERKATPHRAAAAAGSVFVPAACSLVLATELPVEEQRHALALRRRQRRHIDVAERQRLPLLPLLAEQIDVGTFDAQPVEVCVGDGRLDLPRFPVRGSGWAGADVRVRQDAAATTL